MVGNAVNLIFGTLGVVAIVLAAVVVAEFARFARSIVRYRTPAVAENDWPEAAVILSLRGGDDSLRDVLRGLATQNYPRYRIHIVIDSPVDPARHAVRRWQRTHPRVPVTVEYL